MSDNNGTDPWTEAQQAVDGLRATLDIIGVTLQDLGLDVPGIMAGYPSVHLGTATAETVRRITEALQQALM